LTVLLGFVADGGALEVLRKVVILLGLVPALSSAVYKGVLLSTSAQPGWKDSRWLGGYLTSGAVVLGCAEMIILAIVLGDEAATLALRPALVLLLLVHAFPAVLMMNELHPTLQRVLSPSMPIGDVLSVIGCGVALPLIAILIGSEPLILLSAAVFILVGNLASRFMLVELPRQATHQKS
jgi:hypothetical protein